MNREKMKAKMCKAGPKQVYNYKDDNVENIEQDTMIIIIILDEGDPISNDDIEISTNEADLMRKREEESDRLEIMKHGERNSEKVEEKIEKKTEPEPKPRDGKKTELLLTKRSEQMNRLKLMKTIDGKFKIERFGAFERAEHSYLTLKEPLNNPEQPKSRKLKRKRQMLD
ncbi:hypothetical protein GQX74_007974 [Glossina fuscipes]|nr:hypothetical protein GQX74_007974 [Glossina fuscipes]